MNYPSHSSANKALYAMSEALISPERGDEHTVRGLQMHHELLGTQFSIREADRCVVTCRERRLNYRLMVAEALWNLVPGGRMDLLLKFNSGMDRFVADQPEEHRAWARWAYGNTLFTEIPRVVAELKADPNSRRAVVTLPQDVKIIPVGTPPCLISLQFFIRDHALQAIGTMRSNDVWLGLPLDLFQFMFFQNIVAGAVGVPVGWYQHQVGSMHLYQRDVQALEQYVQRAKPEPWPTKLSASDATTIQQIKSGALHRALEGIVHDTDSYQCGTTGFGPYLALLRGDYQHAPKIFRELYLAGIGRGW